VIISYVFAGITALNVVYLLSFSSFKTYSQPSGNVINIPISVIIAAKNEAANLHLYLPRLLTQRYPDFEVVIVNDGSNDGSIEVLEKLQESYPFLNVVNIKHSQGKKYALTKGIAAATNEHLLFTDADCWPTSNKWIATMSQHFSPVKKIILGYGGYLHLPGFLNKLIRYETILTALQYFGLANLGMPYMGVGRNLGYTALLFEKAQGFKSHEHMLSGDDDLFVSQMATAHNTALAFNPNSFTRSLPKHDLYSWFQQKRRHITTASHYSWKHQLILSGFFLSNALFWIVAISAFIVSQNLYYILYILLLRALVQGLVIFRLTRLFKEKGLMWVFPLVEITLLVVQACLFITNIVSKPKRWH